MDTSHEVSRLAWENLVRNVVKQLLNRMKQPISPSYQIYVQMVVS